MLLSFAVTILSQFIFVCIVYSRRTYDTELTGFYFDILDYDIIRNVTTTLQTYKDRKVLNGSFIFRQSLNDFHVECGGIILRPKNDPITLLDVTVNACDTLASALSSRNTNMVKIILKQFYRTKGYFPDRCPLLKDRPISLENFYFDPEAFPPYMPDLNYTAKFHILVNGRYIYKSFINGTVYTKKNVLKGIKKKPSKRKG